MEKILEMKNITKTFPGVKALDDVTFSVDLGEVHAICGENGAGKSTLMNVLSGVYSHNEYDGDIIYKGELCEFEKINDSEAAGIVIIHQELALVPYLSITENIFMGNEKSHKGIINWDDSYKEAERLLDMVGLDRSPDTLVKDLGVSEQQLVEIAKAFTKDVKLLILDEPTASLNEIESANLLNLIRAFKEYGITSIIISHKLNEVIDIADRVTIIRDGQSVGLIEEINENSEEEIIKQMVGRDLTDRFPKRNPNIGDVMFQVSDWSVEDPIISGKDRLSNINIDVKKGEIVGLAGLMGAGRTELALSLFGKNYGTNIRGTIKIDGEEVTLNTVSDAIDNGIAYLTEDRKEAGLVLLGSVSQNTTLASLDKISNGVILSEEKEKEVSEYYKKILGIKTPSIHHCVENLSGGNQQKVVLAKWLLSDPKVLILDEPTRGIDVGSKFEIYKIIEELSNQGLSVLMISSELPELLGMCDRIYVMNEGRITANVLKEEADQELLMQHMVGKEG